MILTQSLVNDICTQFNSKCINMLNSHSRTQAQNGMQNKINYMTINKENPEGLCISQPYNTQISVKDLLVSMEIQYEFKQNAFYLNTENTTLLLEKLGIIKKEPNIKPTKESDSWPNFFKPEPVLSQKHIPVLSEKEKEAPLHLCCPITLEIMTDPVLLISDGYTYERKAIEDHLIKNRTSPMTQKQIPTDAKIDDLLVLNRAIKDGIDFFMLKQENPSLSKN